VSFYLDASAATAILIDEEASAAVARFVRAAGEPLIVSDFAAAEVASAISRLVRMKQLSSEDAAIRLGEFDAWRSSTTTVIDFRPADFRLASDFVRRFDLGLRAPDALHAAVCRRNDLRLVTLDAHLARGAEALGVGVDCLS
jgi:hypothetical protein